MDEDSLFGNLEGGELTDEQWEKFKEFQKQCGNLVCRDSDDEDEEEEEEDEDDDENDGTSKKKELPIVTDALIKVELDSDCSDTQDTTMDADANSTMRDRELINKYLNDELTFTQYFRLAEGSAESNEVVEDEGPEESIEESAEKFFEEMDKRRKKKKRRNKLPQDLKGLLGEANLSLIRGETENAIKMCLEIVRLAPKAPDPFLTLGLTYEEMGDDDKALQYFLIAAFLGQSDHEEWKRLARMSMDAGDNVQALTCYTNAVKCNPNDVELRTELCLLYECLEKKKKALDGYQQILKIMKPDNPQKIWKLVREICKYFYEEGDMKQAITNMLYVFEKIPDTVSSEDINILLELYISVKMYEDCLQILHKYGKVTFQRVALNTEEVIVLETLELDKLDLVTNCSVPDEFPLDLRVKLAIALLHLRRSDILETNKELLQPLYDGDVEEVGDLYLDLAEALMAVEEPGKAEPLLESLINSTKYNLPAVWLRRAECLNILSRFEEAATAYGIVVEMAPTHSEARMSLSNLLQQLGRTDEAINVVMSDDVLNAVQNAQLSVQRCSLLLGRKNYDEFVKVALGLLDSVMPKLETTQEVSAVLSNWKRRAASLREVQKEMGKEVWVPLLNERDIPYSELWDLYLQVCNVLFECKRYRELQEFCIRSLAAVPLTKNPDKLKQAEFYSLLACYFNRDAKYGYKFIRDIVIEQVDSKRAWNMFGQLVGLAQDLRHNRFCLRFVFKQRNHGPLLLLNGHNALVSGSYKHALGEYVGVYKTNPRDPFLCLMIGLTFTHMASQKFAAKKHTLVVQAMAFFNSYVELRGECQESLYNVGRALHQLGLTYMTVHYYKRALSLGPCVSGDEDADGIFDLSSEIAFNLAIIYQNSGSPELGALYLNKYCIIR